MSALVMAEEITRFNEGERVQSRLYAFLSFFLWPLSVPALWVVAMLLLMPVALDDQLWLRRLLICAGLVAEVLAARVQLGRLRATDAALESFYTAAAATAAAPATPATAATPAAAAPPPVPDLAQPTEVPLLNRVLGGLGYVLLAPARCAAKAKFAYRRALHWDEAQIAAGQALFEHLGSSGGAWEACAGHPGGGLLMAGLERLELVEHRAEQGGEIRLHPDIRRRYFPKDPGQAMFAPPPRRR